MNKWVILIIWKSNSVWNKAVELFKEREKELWRFIQCNINSRHFLIKTVVDNYSGTDLTLLIRLSLKSRKASLLIGSTPARLRKKTSAVALFQLWNHTSEMTTVKYGAAGSPFCRGKNAVQGAVYIHAVGCIRVCVFTAVTAQRVLLKTQVLPQKNPTLVELPFQQAASVFKLSFTSPLARRLRRQVLIPYSKEASFNTF